MQHIFFIPKIVNNTENYEIHCSRADTCYIYCKSSESCDLMSLYCYGTCFIDCDESNGFGCPDMTDSDVYPWNFTNTSQLVPINRTSHSGECYEAYSCALDTIENSLSDSVNCYGYFACTQTIKIESDGVQDINCDGSYSCYNSQLIKHTDTASADIHC